MDIIFRGRRTGVQERFREYATAKLGKIVKLDQKTISIDVEVTLERNPRQSAQRERVELTLYSRGPVIRAEAAADDRFMALDRALAKLETHMRRACDRRKAAEHRARLCAGGAARAACPGLRRRRGGQRPDAEPPGGTARPSPGPRRPRPGSRRTTGTAARRAGLAGHRNPAGWRRAYRDGRKRPARGPGEVPLRDADDHRPGAARDGTGRSRLLLVPGRVMPPAERGLPQAGLPLRGHPAGRRGAGRPSPRPPGTCR